MEARSSVAEEITIRLTMSAREAGLLKAFLVVSREKELVKTDPELCGIVNAVVGIIPTKGGSDEKDSFGLSTDGDGGAGVGAVLPG